MGQEENALRHKLGSHDSNRERMSINPEILRKDLMEGGSDNGEERNL